MCGFGLGPCFYPQASEQALGAGPLLGERKGSEPLLHGPGSHLLPKDLCSVTPAVAVPV